jgi:predicted P-loop ATPase
MLSVTGSLVRRYFGDTAILERVMPFAYEDKNVLRFIAEARVKWGIPDPDIPPSVKLGPEVAAAIGRDAAAPKFKRPNWRELYAETQNPKPTFHNTRAAIEALSIECSADVFHGKLFMGRGTTGGALQPFHGEVTDVAIGALRVCLSDAFGLDFTEKHVRDAVVTLCNEHQFNPVVDMLAEAEANWDKVERLDRMAVDHFNAADTPLNRACVRKTMIAAVARARQPGCKFDTITVLEAPEGWNKSSAWAVLAGEGNFSDESILGKASREVQEALASTWVHENAELAGITKAEVETIKAFASRQTDRARPAYGRFLVAQPRHSIEVGTTNADKYLLSQTGNRRFWPVEVLRPIDLKRLRENRLQLWGEAAHYQSQGEVLTLPEALWAAAGVEQEARRVLHPWEGKLAEMSIVVKVDGEEYWGNGVVHVVGEEERVATSAIFEHVLKVSAGQLNNGHSKTVAAIMKMQGWLPYVFELDGKTVRGYRRTKKV